MPDLMRGGPAEAVGRGRGSNISKSCVIDHHAIGSRWPSRKLGIAEQSPTERTDPQVQVFVSVPSIMAPAPGGLDRVILAERSGRSGGPGDAGGRTTERISHCEGELDA